MLWWCVTDCWVTSDRQSLKRRSTPNSGWLQCAALPHRCRRSRTIPSQAAPAHRSQTTSDTAQFGNRRRVNSGKSSPLVSLLREIEGTELQGGTQRGMDSTPPLRRVASIRGIQAGFRKTVLAPLALRASASQRSPRRVDGLRGPRRLALRLPCPLGSVTHCNSHDPPRYVVLLSAHPRAEHEAELVGVSR